MPALEGASRRGLPAAARGAFAGALALFLFTLFFTFSRGGTLALALALVVYFALTNERLQGVLTLALTATPVAAALYLARHLDTLFNATTNDALRTAQGHTSDARRSARSPSRSSPRWWRRSCPAPSRLAGRRRTSWAPWCWPSPWSS